MERLLANKVCIITGAAQGIGRGIAERFAADGAVVYACDRTVGVMDEWARQCAGTRYTGDSTVFRRNGRGGSQECPDDGFQTRKAH